MESLLSFLYSASVSMTLFFMLYWILLRKLTDFQANRFFLLAALLISLLIAAFPIRYETVARPAETFSLRTLSEEAIESGKAAPGRPVTDSVSWTAIQVMIYSSGAFIFLLRLLIQTARIFFVISGSITRKSDNCFIHENTEYSLPFSFFNHIFIHPEFHKQNGLADILAHEKVHIRERHWIDLLFIELLTVLFWFNPFIWFFEHAIKQNHEFLADEGVLSLGHSPVRYQALLVNQLMGLQVIGLTNHLTFALGPNRLNMMNKQKTHKRKLLRMVWAVPVLALLLTAFSQPEYQAVNQSDNQTKASATAAKTIAGKVVNESGKPLYGASVVIRGTSTGTVSDKKGNFSLEWAGTDTEIVISFVGYKSIVEKITAQKNHSLNFTMKRETIGIGTELYPEKKILSPPPPPASPDPVQIPGQIPGQPDEAKEEQVFIIVEEMPEYPGGHRALVEYVREKRDNLIAHYTNKPEGEAIVGFTIGEKGQASNIHIVKKTSNEAAHILSRIIKDMHSWSPGKQRGKPVPVDFEMHLKL